MSDLPSSKRAGLSVYALDSINTHLARWLHKEAVDRACAHTALTLLPAAREHVLTSSRSRPLY